MKFTLEINCNNAAFEDGATFEIARILRELADDLDAGHSTTVLRDANGNRVGQAELHD